MHPISKFLIGSGFLLIFIGLIWQLGGKWLPLGRLPGDIVIEKDHFRFYFPVITSLILSGVFSLLMYLMRYFGGK